VAAAKLKKVVTCQQSFNKRNYEVALKGVESLFVEVEQRQ
jgi:hypothetical protein